MPFVPGRVANFRQYKINRRIVAVENVKQIQRTEVVPEVIAIESATVPGHWE